MVKRNAIATKLTKRCTQTQKRAFDVAVNTHPTLLMLTVTWLINYFLLSIIKVPGEQLGRRGGSYKRRRSCQIPQIETNRTNELDDVGDFD